MFWVKFALRRASRMTPRKLWKVWNANVGFCFKAKCTRGPRQGLRFGKGDQTVGSGLTMLKSPWICKINQRSKVYGCRIVQWNDLHWMCIHINLLKNTSNFSKKKWSPEIQRSPLFRLCSTSHAWSCGKSISVACKAHKNQYVGRRLQLWGVYIHQNFWYDLSNGPYQVSY